MREEQTLGFKTIRSSVPLNLFIRLQVVSRMEGVSMSHIICNCIKNSLIGESFTVNLTRKEKALIETTVDQLLSEIALERSNAL